MTELVDVLVLETSAERREGSRPSVGTNVAQPLNGAKSNINWAKDYFLE